MKAKIKTINQISQMFQESYIEKIAKQKIKRKVAMIMKKFDLLIESLKG